MKTALPFSNIQRGNGGVDTYSAGITITISCFWHFPTQFVQGCSLHNRRDFFEGRGRLHTQARPISQVWTSSLILHFSMFLRWNVRSISTTPINLLVFTISAQTSYRFYVRQKIPLGRGGSGHKTGHQSSGWIWCKTGTDRWICIPFITLLEKAAKAKRYFKIRRLQTSYPGCEKLFLCCFPCCLCLSGNQRKTDSLEQSAISLRGIEPMTSQIKSTLSRIWLKADWLLTPSKSICGKYFPKEKHVQM